MTTITVDDELADELAEYGETRNEQLLTVLRMANQRAMKTDEIDQLAEDIERVDRRLDELQQQLDRLPDSIASELR